jgi:hypothetical protein
MLGNSWQWSIFWRTSSTQISSKLTAVSKPEQHRISMDVFSGLARIHLCTQQRKVCSEICTATALDKDNKRVRVFVTKNAGFDELNWYFRNALLKWLDGEDVSKANVPWYLQEIKHDRLVADETTAGEEGMFTEDEKEWNQNDEENCTGLADLR